MSTIEKAAARLVKRKKNVESSPTGSANVESGDANPVLPGATGRDTHATTDTQPVHAVPGVTAFPDAARDMPAGDATQAATPAFRADASSSNVSSANAGSSTNESLYSDQSEYGRCCELDFEGLLERGFLVPGNKDERAHSELRRIKRPLLLNTQNEVARDLANPTNLIYVTSAVSGEGKTFVATNLALTTAEEVGKSVLLIDGDARKADLSRFMNIESEPGLVDLLVNNNGYGESDVIETNVDHFSVLSSGQLVSNLDELYASTLMTSLLHGMARRDPGRILIVDGPPLLPTTESAILARVAGQVVFVVEANKTPQVEVQHAAALIENCQLVCALLNKSRMGSDFGYGYGYGHNQRAQA